MAGVSKTALITGAGGFTASYIEQELHREGIQVYNLYKPNKALPLKKNDISCDINDLELLANHISKVKPNYIVHLAAISHVQHGNTEDFYKVNVLGTETLLKAIDLAEVNPEKIIIASSANIYGNSQDLPISEECQPNPINHYAISKLAMEFLVKTWFDKFPIIITRPFNYTGVGQSTNFLIPKLIDAFKQKKETLELGNIDISRDFTDVRELAKIYLLLLRSQVKSETVNICSGQEYHLKDIIETLTELTDYKIKIVQNKDLVRHNELRRLVGCNKKLGSYIKLFKFNDIRTTLEWMLHSMPKES